MSEREVDTMESEVAGNDIAVIGMSCHLPGAQNYMQFWQNLVEGNEALVPLSDEALREAGVPESELTNPNYVKAAMLLRDMECFDAGFFGFSPQDARIMDPQHRHFLECAWEAFEDAGYIPDEIEGAVGVYAGSGYNAYLSKNILSNPELVKQVGFFLLRHTGNDKDFLSTRVSYIFDLLGPSVNVQTACSTSLVAIHMAIQSLLNGECEVALAGGVTIELPHHHGYLFKENEILSPDGHCRPFDASSGGTVFGSGAGCVLLKRLDDALADGDRIHAVIKASAINNDGAGKVSYLAPSVDGQAAAIREAIEIADIDPATVEFIECHGTGTSMGDPIEVTALSQAYGFENPKKQYCALGSVKSNIGHLDTAAGVAGIIKSILSLKYQQLVPTLHFNAPNPAIDFASSPFYVSDRLRAWNSEGPRRAAVSSLGVGGTNAHLIIEEAPEQERLNVQDQGFELVCFSARSAEALQSYRERYVDFLGSTDENLRSIAYSASTGRKAFRHRCVSVGNLCSEISNELSSEQSSSVVVHKATEKDASVVFMFAGGGAQYINMGRDLYKREETYRAVVDQCLAWADELLDFDLRAVMFPSPENEEQAKTDIVRPTRTLPVLFITQYAQAKLWESFGVVPDTLIGHSMGEYTAACMAGVFSPQSALSIVCKRGELFEAVPAGAMLSVMLGQDELQAYLQGDICLAAINSQSLSVLSGPIDQIEAIQSRLGKLDIQCQRIRISVAAHSSMLDPVLAEFESFLETIQYQAPTRKVVSNLSGKWLTDEQAVDPKYWVKHLRETVRFADGLSLVLDGTSDNEMPVLVEVGPGNTLASLARQHKSTSREHMIASSMRHPKESMNDEAFMLLSLGKLWCAGVDVNWKDFYEKKGYVQKATLPTYPFERQRHWIEPGKSGSHIADGKQAFDEWFYSPVWQPSYASLAKESSTPILAFSGSNSPFVKNILSQSGANHVKLVEMGDNSKQLSADHWTSALANKSDFTYAFEGLAPDEEGAVSIVYALSLTEREGAAVFDRFFHFAQALSELDAQTLRLTVLISGASAINSTESVINPDSAMLLGACRVLATEQANIKVRLLDIDSWSQEHWAEDISSKLMLNEILTSPEVFESVCYRRGHRFTEEFAHTKIPVPFSEVVPEGVYVVTGGLGGLGLTAAEFLASSGNVNIALITHRAFPDSSDWESHAQRNTQTGRRARRLLKIAESARSLEVYQADVEDLDGLATVLDQIRVSLGPIRGVLHTAGVIDDQLLSLKQVEQCRKVLGPKVQGARNISSCLKGDPIDFLVLYSSVSGLTGMTGQFDYAAANAFLDAYAYQLRAEGVPAVSIDWSAWQKVGMAAELASGERLMGGRISPFDDFVDQEHYRVYVDCNVWWVDEHRTNSGLALVPGTGFVDAAYRAAAQMLGDKPDAQSYLKLTDLFFGAPMMVHDSEQKVMDIQVGKNGLVSIASAGSLDEADSSDWLGEHVEGEALWIHVAEVPSIDIECVKARCQKEIIELKGSAQHEHMDFGPRWACVDSVYMGDQEALVALSLPEQFRQDFTGVTLHPALLDMATGAGHRLVPNYDPETDFFVPLSYGSVTVFSPIPAELYSHISWLSQHDDRSLLNVYLYDLSGRCVVEIERFEVKKMGANALDSIDAQVGSELDVDLSQGILPEEGTKALQSVLGLSNCTQIIVSPENFFGVIENSRERHSPVSLEGTERPSLDSDFAEPKSDFELKMASLWSDALGIDQVGIDDNFFELGGHSLLLTQLATKAKKATGISFPLSKLFDKPTIRLWAEVAEELGADVTSTAKDSQQTSIASTTSNDVSAFQIQPIDRSSESIVSNLSPTQSALWFVHEVNPDNPAYNIPIAMRYKGVLDLDALRSSFDWLVARHEILRTTYTEKSGDMQQEVNAKAVYEYVISEASEDSLRAQMQKVASAPFDLRNGAPIKCHVLQLSDSECVLVMVVHHIALDHLALLQLMKELEFAYQEFSQERIPEQPSPRLHFIDYVDWLNMQTNSELQQKKLDVWRRRLEHFSGVLDLPLDRPRPALPSGKGAQLLFEFDSDLSKQVKQFSSQQSVSLYISLLAAFSALLGRYCKQEDVIVGTPFANRADQEELDDVLGCFINTLPLAIDLAACDSFKSLIAQVKEVMLEAFDNQDVPLNKIVDVAHPARDPSYNPLFQVGFIFQEPPAGIMLDGVEGELLPVHSGGAMYDIHVWIWEVDDGLSGLIWYNTDIFDEQSVQRLKGHFANLLGCVTAAPELDFRAQPLLTEDEENLYKLVNDTTMDISEQDSLISLISRSAQQHSDSIAVQGEGGALSYHELTERSDQLAEFLVGKGISETSNVGVSMSRCSDMLVALLGIMKTGACYVPMDPSYPKERLAYMAEQAEIKLVVCNEAVRHDIDYFSGELLSVDGQWETILGAKSVDLPRVNPDSKAYIIFTSGSTGLPKGVQVPHRTVVNFLESMSQKPGLCSEDRLLAITTLSFDIAVLELYLPLIVGAQTIIATEEQSMDGSELKGLMSRYDINVMQATPSTWRGLLAAGWEGGQIKIMCGGEPFPSDLARTLASKCNEVWNMYGPTETTVWSTCRLVNTEKPNVIGRPIANTRCYIVNEKGERQPVGVAGELLIGGKGVTLGYLNRPELTEKVFLHLPNLEQGLLYRTGDAVKLTNSGELEYVQRIDNQVKVRGYRIELGEIESVILKHESVAECAVMVREYSELDKRIIAYVRFKVGEDHLTSTDLRRYLRSFLPDYMIPQQLMEMDVMPLTPNGKIDRKALPDPNSAQKDAHELLEPRSVREKAIASIWKEAIGLTEVSLDQFFFDIGGHSMLSMQVIYRVEQQFGVRLKATDMVLNTLEQIAAMLPVALESEDIVSKGQSDKAGKEIDGLNLTEPTEKTEGLFKRIFRRGK